MGTKSRLVRGRVGSITSGEPGARQVAGERSPGLTPDLRRRDEDVSREFAETSGEALESGEVARERGPGLNRFEPELTDPSRACRVDEYGGK